MDTLGQEKRFTMTEAEAKCVGADYRRPLSGPMHCAAGSGEGGGGFEGGDPWITFGSFLDHFGPFCLLHFQLCANGLVDLWIIFWKLNCWNKLISVLGSFF